MRDRPISRRAWLGLTVALAATRSARAATDPWRPQRERMVAKIARFAAARELGSRGTLDARVLQAMREVPRHRFVPDDVRPVAYEDTPLPIGHGATISQPFMVARMTDLLAVRPGQKVLEVGAGSGYQAAILSWLGAQVFTIEIVKPLADDAARRLKALGYGNVRVRAGDGYLGWPEAAPFDGVMVTAGATHLPKPLTDQLKPGGRLVIPLGPRREQELLLVTKAADGRLSRRSLGAVAFVPLDERARPR